jgi:ATP-dependent Clp protease protease subunit
MSIKKTFRRSASGTVVNKKSNPDAQKAAQEAVFNEAMFFLESGIDFNGRVIEIHGPVDSDLASRLYRRLKALSSISRDPITILLSTPGGSAYDGLRIYDTIRACPCQINIMATGAVMSMGVVIFLAGDMRFASKNATFMVHSPYIMGSDANLKITDGKSDIGELERLRRTFVDITYRRTQKSKKWWERQISDRPKYFNVREAKKAGLINVN